MNPYGICLQREAFHLARTIKAVIFDVDGVFTNNTEILGLAPGVVAKSRFYGDGQGVSLLRAIGIKVALITNEKNGAAQHIVHQVEKWNNLPSSRKDNSTGWEPVWLYMGCGGSKKLETMNTWLATQGLGVSDCAAMGDDLVDVPMLKNAAFRVVPNQAELAVRSLAHFVTHRPGGAGAVRDFANFLLESRGISPLELPYE